MCNFLTCGSCCGGGCFWVQGEGWAKCFATKEEISATAHFYLFPGQEKHCPPDDTPTSNSIEYSSTQIIGLSLIVWAVICMSLFLGFVWGSESLRTRLGALRLVWAERILEFARRCKCRKSSIDEPIELTSVVFTAPQRPSSTSIEVVDDDDDEMMSRFSSRRNLRSDARRNAASHVEHDPRPLTTVSAEIHNANKTPRNVVDEHPLIDLSLSTSTLSQADTLPPPSPTTPPIDAFYSPKGQDFEAGASTTTTTISDETPKASTSVGITLRKKKRKAPGQNLNESVSTRPPRKAKLDISYVNQ